MPWTVTQYGWLCGFRSPLGGKTKRQKNIPCYVTLHLILVVELRRKSSKSSKSKLPFTPHHRKTKCQFVCHFVFLSEAWEQFSSLKTYLHCTSFQFTMYNSSVILFSLHYSRLKNNLHPRDSRSAKLQSHQRRNPNYLKRILKARKVNNRFCRKLALVFRKHHQHHQCHNSALKKSQRTNVDQITIMLSLTEVCRRYAVEE